ncbi:putative cactin, central domain-containing protein [Helianthus debilis subsp. tardiflorus]
MHSSIEADVKKLLDGKSFAELESLHLEIESEMRSGKAKVVEYWVAVLKRILIYKAKVLLIYYKITDLHISNETCLPVWLV